MTEETLESLKKENVEMKEKLAYINQQTKANNVVGSTFFTIFAAVLYFFISLIAFLGAVYIADQAGGAWVVLPPFVHIMLYFGLAYIAWHWGIVTFCINYRDETETFIKKAKIYINGGRKALEEAKTVTEKKE